MVHLGTAGLVDLHQVTGAGASSAENIRGHASTWWRHPDRSAGNRSLSSCRPGTGGPPVCRELAVRCSRISLALPLRPRVAQCPPGGHAKRNEIVQRYSPEAGARPTGHQRRRDVDSDEHRSDDGRRLRGSVKQRPIKHGATEAAQAACQQEPRTPVQRTRTAFTSTRHRTVP